MTLYNLAVLGTPTQHQLHALTKFMESIAEQFSLRFGEDIVLNFQPENFQPPNRAAAAAIFFGGVDSKSISVSGIFDKNNIPILPVASTRKRINEEIPAELMPINCLFYDELDNDRIHLALLECVGLLPRQRRVFLSYRREESTPAAIQLFSELSARQYEVFLDTHRIGPAVDFQETLWHQLCDVDVLVMLETPNYFGSRWTSAEFGRALAKSIGVLRIQWPDSTPSIQTATASRAELLQTEIDGNGRLSNDAIERICRQLEQVRSLSHAARHLSMITSVQNAIERIEGKVDGIGPHRAMFLTLRSGRRLVVNPTIGVPTAVTLQETVERAGTTDAAVVYDHLGLMRSWQTHIEWLGDNVKRVRWVKSTDAAWDFAGWEA